MLPTNSLAVAQLSMLLSIIIFKPRFLSTKTMQVDIYSVRTYVTNSLILFTRGWLFFFLILHPYTHRRESFTPYKGTMEDKKMFVSVPGAATHIVDVPAAHVRNL